MKRILWATGGAFCFVVSTAAGGCQSGDSIGGLVDWEQPEVPTFYVAAELDLPAEGPVSASGLYTWSVAYDAVLLEADGTRSSTWLVYGSSLNSSRTYGPTRVSKTWESRAVITIHFQDANSDIWGGRTGFFDGEPDSSYYGSITEVFPCNEGECFSDLEGLAEGLGF